MPKYDSCVAGAHGSGRKNGRQSESVKRMVRQGRQANATNRDEWLRTRRLFLAHKAEFEERARLIRAVDGMVKEQLTPEKLYELVQGRPLEQVIKRLVELDGILGPIIDRMGRADRAESRPTSRKARVSSILHTDHTGAAITHNRKDE